jgi:DNA (cytosine-5)-methyltransferase 1
VRKRIFFIGNRMGLPNPFPQGGDPVSQGFLEEGKTYSLSVPHYPAVSVWDAVGDLPDPVQGRPGIADIPLEYTRPAFSDYQRWAREWNGGPPDGRVHNHVARRHSERDVRVFGAMAEGMWWRELPQELKMLYGYREDIFHDKIKRLRRDRPSWTVVAHLYKDGYMYVHPTQPRTITVREAARLQGFPDAFIFRGSRTDQFKQVGNAVPPLMAKAVAAEIRKILEHSG